MMWISYFLGYRLEKRKRGKFCTATFLQVGTGFKPAATFHSGGASREASPFALLGSGFGREPERLGRFVATIILME